MVLAALEVRGQDLFQEGHGKGGVVENGGLRDGLAGGRVPERPENFILRAVHQVQEAKGNNEKAD